MQSIQLKALLVLLSFMNVVVVHATDVLHVTDTPHFTTEEQNLWGLDQAFFSKTFDNRVTNIDLSDDQGVILGVDIDNEVAVFVGSTQFLCPAGDFIDPFTDDCYSCPEGFAHDPLKNVDDPGVCFRRHSLTTADPAGDAQFICPAGSFLDVATGGCYRCSDGFSQNPLLPASTPGVCSATNTELEHVTGSWSCRGGDFTNISGTGCYSCPGSYSHNAAFPVGVNGACFRDGINTRKARNCGNGSKCSKIGIDPFKIDAPGNCSVKPSNCPSAIRRSPLSFSDFKWFSCDGFSHNPLFSLSDNRVCFRGSFLETTTANFEHNQSCGAGEVKNVLDGNCYGCPSGFTNILGVCTQIENTTAAFVEDPGFLCGTGEFLSGSGCFTCPVGKRHEFALPAQVPGVCYESDDIVAEDAGNQSFLCPADSFPNVVDGLCYRCPNGYVFNPLLPIDQSGVCFKMTVVENAVNPSFEVGYEMSSIFHYQQGWTGGVTVDSGSIDVQYSPTLTVQLSPDGNADEGWPIYSVAVAQDENSLLAMQTQWAKANVFLDQWTDVEFAANISFIYPELDTDTLTYSQQRSDVTLWNADSNGRRTLADEPLIEAEFSNLLIGIRLLGFPVDASGFFDPPYEVTKTIVDNGGFSIGFVVAELGLQVPLLNTPAQDGVDIFGNDRPFKADYSETVVTAGSGANTFITQSISAGERTGFRLFSSQTGLKDTDAARVNLDIDGLIATATNTPLGLKLAQKKLKLTLWSISQDVADIDFGGILAFETNYTFKPKLDVILSFSLPVWPVDDSGALSDPVTQIRTPLGTNIRFAHPGGALSIATEYSLQNNQFENDTDLTLTSIISGDFLSTRITILGVPVTTLPKFSVLHFDVEPNPEPFKLMDMNFLDGGSVSRFKLGGFDDITGSTLLVTEAIAVAAACKDFSIALDAEGNALIAPQDIDGGSQISAEEPLLSVMPAQLACNNLGENTLTLTVANSAGATKTCEAVVNVVDNISPEIQFVQPVSVEASGSGGAKVALDFAATDNCAVSVIQIPDSDSLLPLGESHVELVATDMSGNQTTRSVTVSVVDTTPPVVIPPAALTIEATDVLTRVDYGLAVANDLVDGVLLASTARVAQFSVGSHSVVWSASDRAGNRANAIQLVTILDSTLPLLRVTPRVTVEASAKLTAVELDSAEAEDVFNVIISNDAPALYPLGLTTVTWIAKDSNGNQSSAITLVDLVDQTEPDISVSSGLVLVGDSVIGGRNLNDVEIQDFLNSAAANDKVYGVLEVSHNAPKTLPFGSNEITFSAVDPAGNRSTRMAIITINDPAATGAFTLASSGTGLTVEQSLNVGLNPNATTTDTDGDGVDDYLEIGDPSNPNDSDGDGVLDVFESGDGANDASAANGLMVQGSRVDIQSNGQKLSQVSSDDVGTGAPSGVSFPFGIIRYQTTVAEEGGEQTVRFKFQLPLPDSLVLYKVDNAGVYSEIPESKWTQVDTFSLDLNFTDGGVFDLDAEVNGIIVDPLAVGNNPGSGGSLSPWTLLLLLLVNRIYLRRMSSQYFKK